MNNGTDGPTPVPVVVTTNDAASWYAACAILGGGLVVTAAGAARSAYTPRTAVRAKALARRAVLHGEYWLQGLVLAAATALGLGGHYGIGDDEGTSWGRLFPSVGLLALVAAACPIRSHPSWAAAAADGPLRTWVRTVPPGWAVGGTAAAAGGLALMGLTRTWDALAANVVALVVAWLHPFRPALRASPSRLGEDVGDGLLLLPGLYGPDRAYTLEGPDDRLIQLAVPTEADEERRPPTSSTPVEVAVPSSLADGAGTGSHRLSVEGVARQLYGMARAEAAAHRVTWRNDALRERRRWSLRAMLRGLLAPSVGEDAALAAVGVLPTPAPAVALSVLLDSLLVLPPTPDDDSAVAGSSRGSNPASHAAGANGSTPPAAGAPTPPASSGSSGAGSRRPTRPPRYASTGAASTSTSSSTDDWRKRADTLFTRLFALGTLGLVLEAPIDPTYEERGDVTSPATLLYHEWVNDVAEDWSGDTEVPVRQVGAYSAEGIRRLVCRGLMLVQATTYVYALAGAVATELLA
ncbi:hypothetical protein I4F81_001369 [Pyropia yezoensis]|uniref:Uncharacterized protein n=1 Tax=Pyropia yezoensis TaxID=2788 RepID=A0ACC3BMF5_PYRYE|nr:hypothetical protein I4F81_001369 [Neopyropia yezoensis]